MSHVFDHALELDKGADGVLSGRTRPEWENMVGPSTRRLTCGVGVARCWRRHISWSTSRADRRLSASGRFGEERFHPRHIGQVRLDPADPVVGQRAHRCQVLVEYQRTTCRPVGRPRLCGP